MSRTTIPREDISRHTGSGPVIEYKLDQAEHELYQNMDREMNRKAIRRINMTRYKEQVYVPPEPEQAEQIKFNF